MKRKIMCVLLCAVLSFSFISGCSSVDTNTTDISSEQENAKMKIQIGDRVLTATLEDNESAAAFQELIKNEGLSIKFSRYGEFEQVGSIGTSLPRNDVQTTTKVGDIVLYSGNQLVIFYGSNSWAYTRIGKFDSTKDLEEILGKEDITATFTME